MFPYCCRRLRTTQHDMTNRKGRKRTLPADASFVARLPAVLRDREKRGREIRDRAIVIYLKILKRNNPYDKMDWVLVPETAEFFDVSIRTVWSAWRAMKHQSLQSLIDGTGLLRRL
jgi:hypothetical protein